MKPLSPILLLTASLALAGCSCPQWCCSSSQSWTDISSLDHWRGYKLDHVPEAWENDAEGAIHLTGGGAGDLITREEYSSFLLELEWKISPRGNSGIMFRVSEDQGATYMSGPEMQVLDNAVYEGEVDLLHAAGADYGLHAPARDDSRPAGEWNAVRIQVDGPHVEYWLNGVRQCAYELGSEDWNARVAASKFSKWPVFGRNESGHIALQDHGNEVWFRNIRIRRL